MGESEYIFIMVTSDGCGHCTHFLATDYEPLVNRLLANGKFTILHGEATVGAVGPAGSGGKSVVKYKTVSKSSRGMIEETPTKININPMFINLVKWFPQFFVFRTSVWNSDWSKSKVLEGGVLNGNIVRNEKGLTAIIRTDQNQIRQNSDNIYSWLMELSNSPSHGDTLSSRGHSHIKPTFAFRDSVISEDYH